MTGRAMWEPYRKTIAAAVGQRQCRQKNSIQAMTIPALPTIT
jgi:hypothetical protein